MSAPARSVHVHDEVRTALDDGRPVVALETAVVTHGLPRSPRPDVGRPVGLDGDLPWDEAAPLNLMLARSMAATVRAGGAVPATIAVLDGVLHVGLEPEELERLAATTSAEKAAAGSLAAIMGLGADAGTTVSGTLVGCRLAARGRAGAGSRSRAGLGTGSGAASGPDSVLDSGSGTGDGIRWFATGGIGGVHRGWTSHLDVSADLLELGRSRTAVVCAGIKSILDVPATLEALEAIGVPVLGVDCEVFPLFQGRGDATLTVPHTVRGAAEAAAVVATHLDTLGRPGGLLLVQPCPESVVMDRARLEDAIEQVEAEADRQGVRGPARTPWILDALATATGGASIRANLGLLIQNARLATTLAMADAP